MVTHPQCHNENQLPLPSKIETEKLCRFRRSVPILNKLRYGFISHICDRDTFMLSFWMRHCVGLEGVGNYTHSLWQRYGMATACSCTRQVRRAAEDPYLLLSPLRPGDFGKSITTAKRIRRLSSSPNWPFSPGFDSHVVYSFLFGDLLPLFLLSNLSMYIPESINDMTRMRTSK